MPNLPKLPPAGNQTLDRALEDWRGRLLSEGLSEFLHGWLADDYQTIELGNLPNNSYVMSVRLHVTEAFDSDGTDQIQVGWDADNDALATLTDVSTTGVKSITMGANDGFNSNSQTVKAYYVNGGSEPTTGKALVIVEFIRVKSQIA